jgi:hypothetical protein
VAFAIASGAHPKKIQEMLGHTSVKTIDIYGHIDTSIHEDVALHLDKMLREAREPPGNEATVTNLANVARE